MQRGLAVIAILCCLVLILAWSWFQKDPPLFRCDDPIGCVSLKPDEPILIGVLQDVTGPTSIFGLDQIRSIEFALKQRQNQLFGHPIILEKADTKCSPEGGRVAAQSLTSQEKLVGILGTTCSSSATTASKAVSESGMVLISGLNAGHSLTATEGRKGKDWHPGYFRTQSNSYLMGRLAAEFVFKHQGIKSIVTVNDGDNFTKGMSDMFEQAFTSFGGKVVLSLVINKNDMNMKPVVDAIIYSGVDFVFSPLFQPEAIALIQQLRQTSNSHDIQLLAADTIATRPFFQEIGPDGLGIYFIIQRDPETKQYRDFVSTFRLEYNLMPLQSADKIYDATNLLLDALKGIMVHDKNGGLHFGRHSLRERLYSVKNYNGVSGVLSCDKFGDCGHFSITITQLNELSDGLEGLKENIVYPETSNSKQQL